jgi:mannitol-1-phosphate 5-dehydrogenase
VPTQTIVVWGAGRIGRGFVADLFDAAGYRIVLVDESEELVERLRQAGCYTVVRAESAEKRTDQVVSGFSALAPAQVDEVATAVAGTDLMAVAVYPKDFPAVTRQLMPGLSLRQAQQPEAPLDIILCANIPHPGEEFGALLQEAMPSEMREYAAARIGIVDSLVIRMVADPPAEIQRRDPLLVWTNGYAGFPVDRHAFKGEIPQVPGLRLVDDMRAEEARKLYTYNTFHAALAYHGARRGYEQIVDCMADPAVRVEAEGALRESRIMLQAEYGFAGDDMGRWIEGVLAQTNNPTLRDTVNRYGADPRRKLRRSDRLVGPALLARKHGIATPHLIRALAAALLYRNPRDAGATYVQEQIASLGLPDAIRTLCELTPDEEDLVAAIAEVYDRLRAKDHWADLARQASALAFEHEKIYHGCGQCALAAILETLDQFDEAAAAAVFEAATGLAGGLGLVGNSTCAALIGATLAFGMLYPRRRVNFDGDRENKYRTFSMAQRLRQRYLDAYDSIFCHDIHRRVLGRAFDLRDPAEREAFEAAGAHDDKCTGVVAHAARWAVEIIGEEQRKNADTLKKLNCARADKMV